MTQTTKSKKVFVVHGHDDAMKEAAARTLTTLKLDPIILHEQPSEGRTIIEKFETYSDVGYAIILMSPDDRTIPKDATDSKKVKSTYRARQNVILELGFFIGKLGRNNVFVLQAKDVEIPSDYQGVIYHPYDHSSGAWRLTLVHELQQQGFSVDANDLLKRPS